MQSKYITNKHWSATLMEIMDMHTPTYINEGNGFQIV